MVNCHYHMQWLVILPELVRDSHLVHTALHSYVACIEVEMSSILHTNPLAILSSFLDQSLSLLCLVSHLLHLCVVFSLLYILKYKSLCVLIRIFV